MDLYLALPRSMGVRNIHKIEKYSGFYNESYSPRRMWGWLGSCTYYQTGLAAAGGSIEVSCGSSGVDVTFDKILSVVGQPGCDSVSIETGIFNISQIKRAWWIRSDRFSYNTYTTNPDSPPPGVHCQEIDITKITLDNGFLVSDEFLSIIDNGASICFIIDYTDYIMGTTDENQTVLSLHTTPINTRNGVLLELPVTIVILFQQESILLRQKKNYLLYCRKGYKTSGSVSIDLDSFDTGSNKK